MKVLIHPPALRRSVNITISQIANEYAESVKTFQALKQHVRGFLAAVSFFDFDAIAQLVVVNTQLTEVTAKFRTSACHDASGYYGLTDWAEVSLSLYIHLFRGLWSDIRYVPCRNPWQNMPICVTLSEPPLSSELASLIPQFSGVSIALQYQSFVGH